MKNTIFFKKSGFFFNGFGEKPYIDYIMDYNIGYNIWISIYGFPGIPGGIHGYLGGTDGTLGPMGPWDRWDLGLMDPRYFLRGYFLRVVYRYPARPAGPGVRENVFNFFFDLTLSFFRKMKLFTYFGFGTDGR